MGELFIDSIGVILLLAMIILLYRYKGFAPHSEYLKLLEEMPPYDHSDLELDELKEKIEEAEANLKVLETLMEQAEKGPDKMTKLRHKMSAIRLQLLKYEMLKRQLEEAQKTR